MGVSVNAANGNLLLSANDLSIGGVNQPLTQTRAYNSLLQQDGYLGGGGYGWGFAPGWDRSLHIFDDGSAAFLTGDGTYYPFIRNPDGTFQTPYGLQADLQGYNPTPGQPPDGHHYMVTFHATGEKWTFNTGGPSPDASIIEVSSRYGQPNSLQGRFVSISHNNDGTVNHLTDTEGRQLSEGLDPSYNHVNHITDWTGRQLSYSYDPTVDRMTSATDGNSKTVAYGYDSSGRLNRITTPMGNVTLINYDGQGRVSQLIRTTNPEHTTGPTTTFAYTPGVTSVCNDPANRMQTQVSDPDANGANGHYLYYCTNAQDRVLKTVDSAGNVNSSAYDPNGNAKTTSAASPGNGVVNAQWDQFGQNLLCVQQGTTQAGNCQQAQSGLKSTYNYADGTSGTGQGADPLGSHAYLSTQTTDPRTHQTNACYYSGTPACTAGTGNGPGGALQQQSNQLPAQNTQRFSYNADGNPNSSTDANANVTTYGYNTAGELISTTPPAGSGLGATTIQPDGLNHPHSITDGAGHTQTFRYDNVDRVVEIDYSHQGGPPIDFSVIDTYDDDGNLTQRTDAQGTTTYTIDPLNRTTNEALPGGLSNAYTWDDASNLTSFTDSGGQTQYNYNGLNQLTSLQEPGDSPSALTTFAYDGNGNRTNTTYPSGVSQTNAVDGPTGRITSITGTKPPALGSGMIASRAYQYNDACSGGSGVDTPLVQCVTDQTASTTVYQYDALDRLTDAATSGTNANHHAYTLDGNGNILQKTANPSGSTGGSNTYYAYNTGDQMCWSAANPASACASPPTGATTYTYDLAGNQTASSTGNAFAYNSANQTTTWNFNGSGATSLGYLGTGQDALTTIGTSSLQNSMLGVTREQLPSGTRYYTRDSTGTLTDARTPNGRYNYLTDNLGSVIALTDQTGNPTATYQYSPYGEPIGTGVGTNNPFGYASGYQMPGGAYHYGQRYYDPSRGRWTQLDPNSTPDSSTEGDRYAYAGGDPANQTDPSGCSIRAFVSCITINTGKHISEACGTACYNCQHASTNFFGQGPGGGVYAFIVCSICGKCLGHGVKAFHHCARFL